MRRARRAAAHVHSEPSPPSGPPSLKGPPNAKNSIARPLRPWPESRHECDLVHDSRSPCFAAPMGPKANIASAACGDRLPATDRGTAMNRKKKGNGGAGAQRASPTERLKRKDYEKQLTKLHVELVRLQEWVKYK